MHHCIRGGIYKFPIVAKPPTSVNPGNGAESQKKKVKANEVKDRKGKSKSNAYGEIAVWL